MTSIGQDLRGSSDLFEPKPRQIWKIDDKKIRFIPEDKRNLHDYRYVLVVMNEDLCNLSNKVYNVIPLSTKGSPDFLRYPLKKECYSKNSDDELTNKSQSLLVVNHYQPVNSEYLEAPSMGSLKEEIYESVLLMIKENLLGLKEDPSETDINDYL